MSKLFLDTNVLVYSLDKHDRRKQRICRDVLRTAARDGSGVVSTQVLQEFFVVATKKLGIDPLEAKALVQHFENFEVVTVTPAMIEDAVDCSVLHRLSFWDALIVTAAESAACSTLLTEDLSHGQTIRGVKVANPVA